MVNFVKRSLDVLKRKDSARLLFLMPIDWYSPKGRASQWEAMDAHIHHIYPIRGRVDYLINDVPCSETQKVIKGIPVFKDNGEPDMMSGRKVSDAVFDIRLGKNNAVTTYLE
jgi:hypothetical protein